MENKKRYHGYLALPRHSLLLQKKLGHSLFSLYLALVMDARWYRANPKFGYVVGTQTEIASRLGISQSTLSRGIDKLSAIDKKLVKRSLRSIVLGYFPLFLTDVADKMYDNNYANLHDLYTDLHRINAEMQDKYEELQKKRAQKRKQRLNRSFNDDLSSLRDDVEYEDKEYE